MDTHCPPLYSTVLTTHHPHWDTQEDASHQAMHSTQPFRPQEYPRLSSNLTELSLQVYEVPDHLASQSQQQNYTPPEFFEPKPSFPETNQQGVLNSSSDFQAQHVQSYLSFKPNNYKSIAASFTGSNSSSANATEFNMTPFYEDLQAYMSSDTDGLRNSVPNTAKPLEGNSHEENKLVDGAKWNHEVIAKQAVRKLFGRVRSRTRLSPPSTLKELYQAGFNSLNARMCRDLLYKWAIIMGKPKGSRHVKKPSWWPETVRYASASELDGLEIKAVLFHFFYSQQNCVLFGKFYAARRDINITEKDEKTLSWILSIRHVFKTDIKLPLP
ncbi:hypothetical protein CBS147333_9212 [Penicillium roqueforti]|nr:hypothetical protein CBS147333_9212 [Penicillium roqueforti]KAI3262109.1 hypothetical protein CBS147308_9483 [Penicillium roqueforti]KAI3279623.1 hypothetical protein DTO003C3_9607 [Penicillium roqueforti]